VGFSLACLFGLIIGLVSGVWTFSAATGAPSCRFFNQFRRSPGCRCSSSCSASASTPIVLVISSRRSFPMAVSVMNAVEQVDIMRVDVARLMGATKTQLLSKVYAPEVVPAIITGAQVGFGNAWRSLIAAEMVGGVNVGLGWFINFSGEVADMVGVLTGIFVIGCFSALLDGYALERLKRRLLRWKYV
jgi:NitT/TauT family transport system permease protein